MILEDRMLMYLDKKSFIENLNESFQIAPGCPSVEGVSYELYTKDYGAGRVDEREWVIVHFYGGGKSVRLATGNSNIANFRIVGEMLAGGYYAENATYQKQVEDGYSQVEL